MVHEGLQDGVDPVLHRSFPLSCSADETVVSLERGVRPSEPSPSFLFCSKEQLRLTTRQGNSKFAMEFLGLSAGILLEMHVLPAHSSIPLASEITFPCNGTHKFLKLLLAHGADRRRIIVKLKIELD